MYLYSIQFTQSILNTVHNYLYVHAVILNFFEEVENTEEEVDANTTLIRKMIFLFLAVSGTFRFKISKKW